MVFLCVSRLKSRRVFLNVLFERKETRRKDGSKGWTDANIELIKWKMCAQERPLALATCVQHD